MSTTALGRTLSLASGAVLAVVLTGCGVAGTNFKPGVAAEVDRTVVSTGEVDDLVKNYCDAVESDPAATEGSVVPLGYLRSAVAGQLAMVEAAEQLADDHGVEAGEDYTRAVAEIESQTEGLSESQREAVVELSASSVYISAVQVAVGEQLLSDEGGAASNPEAAGQRGAEAFDQWLADHDVRFNPDYGIELQDGQVVNADQSLSVAVGKDATTATLEQPDQEYAARLPDSQRCG